MYIKPHRFLLPFAKKEQIAKDTFAFYFDRNHENWDFHPGQYIQMRLPLEHPDERGTMRYFTIASSPTDKQYLRIVTKVIQSTFKLKLASLQKGEKVSFFGPNGDFYLQEKEPSHVFLAGGIGMTPFVSMMEYTAIKNLKNNITFFAVFSTLEEMIFFEKFSKITIDRPNIQVVYSLINTTTVWTGQKGRISPSLIEKYISDIKKPIYYITGPPPMVEATVTMIGEMGISEEHIFQEHFSGY